VKLVWKACLMAALLAPLCSVRADEGPKPASLEAAERLFRQGKLSDAEPLFRQLQKQKAARFRAALRLGQIALFRNRLDEAEEHFTDAILIKPRDLETNKAVFYVFYRRDDFPIAGAILRSLGDEAGGKKLESFKGVHPYQIEQQAEVTHVPFVVTDPLPLIQVKIGGEAAQFLIDTGAPELFIDRSLAKKVGAREFGTTRKLYAGGLQAETGNGRIDSIAFGDAVVRNVPVLLLDMQGYSAVTGGQHVDGILGTNMLSHFLATLDYPGGQLILRRKTPEDLQKVQQQTHEAKGTIIPFWMAGDHYMVACGRVNKSGPLLFFIDTGVSGGGFVCPRSTLVDGGITLPRKRSVEGLGAGGKVNVVPFVVQELSLGSVKARQINAFAGAFPPALEYSEGFRIAGIISHQFFRPYALTFDFQKMHLFLIHGRAP
jgi:Aspartyl protease